MGKFSRVVQLAYLLYVDLLSTYFYSLHLPSLISNR